MLAKERDLDAYVRLGAELGGRLVAWGRVDDALAVWRDVLASCAGRDVPSLGEHADQFARSLAAAKRYADAAVVAARAVEAARQRADAEPFWLMADYLAFYLEHAGRLEQAMGLWRDAIDAGSNLPRTFDRLSLALDRAGSPGAAAEVCEKGLARFPPEARRYKLVQQIERRAERCRAKVRLANDQ
jgi:tetratricopeptide (TPR) repeat protein